MSVSWQRLLCLCVVVVLVAGCGRSSVVRRDAGGVAGGGGSPAAARPAAGGASEAVVARGETLYGIAFRHGLDYREVARWNGISAPYTIYPGQRIRLHPAGGQAPAATAARAPASRPASGASASTPAPRGAASAATSGRTTPSAAGAAASTPTPAPRPATTTPPAPATTGPVNWRWPAEGQLVGRFAAGDPTRQGIDIAGNAGQEVRAAADGVVVYSGSGLVGYGELVIIKHTDEWLSAYGHNRRRLVEEGQSVRGGEQVAEMGRSGASRDMLHFEIRRNGRPVDPLPLLPPR